MGFSMGGLFSGGASGAGLGFMLGGPMGAAIGAGAGGLLGGMFSGDPQTVSQGPLETPEQRAARQQLLQFAQTGRYGNYTAGMANPYYTPGAAIPGYTPGADVYAITPYNAPLGNYDISAMEQAGGDKIQQMLTGGMPAAYDAGVKAMTDVVNGPDFNPLDPNGQYKNYSDLVDLNTKEAVNNTKRDLAFGGTLYNSGTAKEIGKINENAANLKSSKLADLYQNYVQQKINLMPQLVSAGATGENIDQNRINQAFAYGGLSRNLADTAAQRNYQEWLRTQGLGYQEALRKRSEVTADASRRQGEITADATQRYADLKLPLSVLGQVSGSNVPFGVQSMTVPTQGPLDNLLNVTAQIGGDALGRYFAMKGSPGYGGSTGYVQTPQTLGGYGYIPVRR